jgi:cold shock CspA family protein/tetratricopeptide (TPR) repeat protein
MSEFDAVIWSSSKTTKLDPIQIRDIDGAIRDSLGLFNEVGGALGAQADDNDIVAEIIDYLATFKVLVILDNLETVIDDRVRSFFASLPSGSKVLVTSRIGIGEFEYRVNLQPLPGVDGARLLRAAATVSGLTSISRRPEHELISLSDRMHNNPLFIKWFVAAVQSGMSPEQVLFEPGLFLDFCMSNVYEHLSGAAQALLKALLAAPDELSLPELIYYQQDETYETQAAVQELLTTNMLVMNSFPGRSGGTVESRYRLTDLTRQYLMRNHPLTPDEDRDLDRVQRRLEDDRRRITLQMAGDQFDQRTVVTRSKSDLLVVVPLLDGLRLASAGRFGEALDAIGRAKSLAPDYYECFRVEAQVHAAARNVVVADAAFRTAIDLAPKSAPTHYFYARFLREVRRDVDAALEEISKALDAGGREPELLLEGARCNLEALSFGAARAQIDDLLADLGTSTSNIAAETWGQSAEFWLAKANFSVQTRDYMDVVACLESLRRDVEACPGPLLAAPRFAAQRSIGAAWCCEAECKDEGVLARARGYTSWLKRLKGIRLPATVRLSDVTAYGSVKFVNREKGWGLMSSSQHGEVYFTRMALVQAGEFELLRGGVSVSYILAASDRGRRALDVRII